MSTISTNDGDLELPDTMTALEVLRQAGDLLEVSYWIKQHEFSGFNLDTDVEIISGWTGDLAKYNGKKKGFKQRKTAGDTSETRYITQMCSIGALAMSRMTSLENAETDGVPMVGYGSYWNNDLPSTLAGQALMNVITRRLGEYYVQPCDDLSTDDVPFDIITGWNDDAQRTREEVVEFFREAEKEPCLGYSEIWRIQYNTGWGDYTNQLHTFGSEQEVNEAMTYLMAVEIPKTEDGYPDVNVMDEGYQGLNRLQWATRLRMQDVERWQPVRVLGAPVPA